MPPDDVLDIIFSNPDHEDYNSPLVDDEIINQIPGSSANLMQEEADQHERMTRKLFGEAYGKEYLRRMRQGLQ